MDNRSSKSVASRVSQQSGALSGILKNKNGSGVSLRKKLRDPDEEPVKKKELKEKVKKLKKTQSLLVDRPITEASQEESKKEDNAGFDGLANWFKNLFNVCGNSGCCTTAKSEK